MKHSYRMLVGEAFNMTLSKGLDMYKKHNLLILLVSMVLISLQSRAQDSSSVVGPIEHVYKTIDNVSLKAHVFLLSSEKKGVLRPAIVIFHGGGWNIGSPEWAFSRARHFAKQNMVAVAAQYRLSDQETITPLEAMADARAVIHWMRSNAKNLGIDKDRIAAYGWSAGAHLAASAAIFSDSLASTSISSSPNALVLISPAVSLEKDGWVKKLLMGRTDVKSISPDEHIREGLPPTIILQGRTDTVTPLEGVKRFHQRMLTANNHSELIIYDEVGHLFTPSSEPDDGWPNPDPKIQDDAFTKIDQFLSRFGYKQ